MHHRLPNYVRTARKNAGLSARDLASLLGKKTAGCISRYEAFARNPALKSAIFLEVALSTTLTELFPNLYEDARERIVRHAEALLERIGTRKSSPLIRARAHRLRNLVEKNNALKNR